MSTTPMHRPFLVRQDIAATATTAHSLYLVPAPRRSRALASLYGRDTYKVAAVLAALFLVLTVC